MMDAKTTAKRTARGKQAGHKQKHERLFIVLTLVPTLIVLTFSTFYPTVNSLFLSFFNTKMNTVGNFVGLNNYISVLRDREFWCAFGNTGGFAVGATTLSIVSGLSLAVLLNTKMRCRRIFRTIFFLPYVVPYAAHTILWMWLFDPRYGLWNYLLNFIGLGPFPWIKSADWVIPSFIIMNVWKRTGFTMVQFLAGLQTIPEDLYEAATIDGAGPWRRFRFITMPLLRPITLFVLIMTLAGTIQLFIEPFVMTKGGPGVSSMSVVYMLYSKGFGEYNLGGASAIAVILFLVIFPITLLLIRTFSLDDDKVQ